jgi:mannosyltransferase OCH1-like enzyme
MISKILHQIWIGSRPPPVALMATWREKNPSYQYKLWDNARCIAFGFRNAAKIRDMPELCGKADLMRYEILARHGGVYVDADSECVRPLDDHFLAHEAWCCFENEIARPSLLANGYLGASVGSPLM